jgi:nicotinamide phosphoribosyltransferase
MANYQQEMAKRKLLELGFTNEMDLIDAISMDSTFANPLLATDVYKIGHMTQYAPGTTKVVSYLMARSNKVYDKTVFFGLHYWLKRYFTRRITMEMGHGFIENANAILGPQSDEVKARIKSLCELGYIPLEIKAVPEGTVMPTGNVLLTITNTHPDFFWCVGFFESLILKVWDAISTASCSYTYLRTTKGFYEKTCDSLDGLEYAVHDFGYRGCSSEAQAALTGLGHLLSFNGSDTVPAREFGMSYYNVYPSYPLMGSVPASEHSVMCSFGKQDELEAFRHMLRLYPTGIVSIVSDTYDVYQALTTFAEKLRPEILSRDGKVVFRPDSGHPEDIICGDPKAAEGSPEFLGAIRLLDKGFGSTVNSKGYKVLNPKVGLIYGDGMYLERYIRTLERLEKMGYAASNLVIGVGGILRNHSRDTLGFALKAVYVEINGQPRDIEKTPITDKKKQSHKGRVALVIEDGEYKTIDQCSDEDLKRCVLQTVFKDGEIINFPNFAHMRNMVRYSL